VGDQKAGLHHALRDQTIPKLGSLNTKRAAATTNTSSEEDIGWVSWCTPVIPALRRLRQKDLDFKTSLGYKSRL
jgi:hypothetical protein